MFKFFLFSWGRNGYWRFIKQKLKENLKNGNEK
jgi:hypothetical protein